MSGDYEKVRNLCGFNLRILHFKYLGPTNTKGSRVKIDDKYFSQSITIPYNYKYRSAAETAVAYLIEDGWAVEGINGEIGIILMSEWGANRRLKGKKKPFKAAEFASGEWGVFFDDAPSDPHYADWVYDYSSLSQSQAQKLASACNNRWPDNFDFTTVVDLAKSIGVVS